MVQTEENRGSNPLIESRVPSLSPYRGFPESFALIALAAILVLGAAFRLVGVNWDENQHLHPDERFLTMVETAIQIPASVGEYFNSDKSPLSPYNKGFGFVYGTFPIFLTKAIGEVTSNGGYDQITILGRELSALFDLATVALIFFIGRRLYDWRVGLLASLLLAATVTNIQQSHYFTVDTFTNVPVLLAMLGAIWVADGKDWRAFLFAGAFLGLAVAGRINMGLFAGIIALAGAVRIVRAFKDYHFTVESNRNTNPSPIEAARIIDPPTVRSYQFGPLSLTAYSRPATRSHVASGASESSPFRQFIYTATFLFIAALASLIVFRIAQPYAFNGLFGLNQKFVNDMNYVRDLSSGAIDYPPSHNWTDRTPFLFPLYNIIWYGMGIPLGIAGWLGFLLAGWELIRSHKWAHLLVFFWVGGSFLFQGLQFVKTLRYFFPIIPFLVLFAAYLLIWLWDKARSSKNRLAIAFAGLAGLAVVGFTLFYAIAFIHIYQNPSPRIAASRWIYANIPCGSTVGNEHWDDPIPLRIDGKDGFSSCYKGIEFQNYAEDEDSKRENLLNWIDQSDYIFLTSDRLWGSIPRLPLRYPLTTKYYGWLFGGDLGFDLVTTFQSYPQVGPIVLNDDPSEEIFRNYEHPKVWIFKKSQGFSREKVAKLFAGVDLSQVIRQWPLQLTEARNGLLLTQNEFVINRAGGTWSDIYHPDDLLNRFPIATWILALELIGSVCFPIVFVLFRKFRDRGFALTKTLGILLVGFGTWTLASYHILPFSRFTILAVLCILGLLSLLIGWLEWGNIKQFIRASWRLVLFEEVLWLAFFTFFLLVRFGNPDLWHPWFGGEKPMDFAFLNAVTKSTFFPPYDPWFEGGRINYYYFGQLISANLLRLTGIVPEVGYNLLLPMFFAMTALGTFTVVFNLVANVSDSRIVQKAGGNSLNRAVIAGIGGALLVVLIGNLGEAQLLMSSISKLGDPGLKLGFPGLDQLLVFLSGIGHILSTGKWIDLPIGNYYWNATRTIPETINEFPFFTFLYADLHAHLISMAFTVATISLAVHAIFLRARLNLFDLILTALTLGSLRAINTWDFPTYFAVLGAALVIGLFASTPGTEPKNGHRFDNFVTALVVVFFQLALLIVPGAIIGAQYITDVLTFALVIAFSLLLAYVQRREDFDILETVRSIGWRFAAIAFFAVIFYFPFIINYGAGYTSIEAWKDKRTTPDQYLIVHGIFLFMVGSYLALQFWNTRARLGSFRFVRLLAKRRNQIGRLLWLKQLLPSSQSAESGIWAFGFLAVALLMIVLVLLDFGVVTLTLPFLVLALALIMRDETPPAARFISLLVMIGTLMTLMVEFITLKGDIGRMNTVFKFYLQVWIFFGIASATGLALVWDRIRVRSAGQVLWWVVLIGLLIGGFSYTAFAGWAKVTDRYPIGDTAKLVPTLDGMDYMKIAVYQDQNKDLQLIYDYDAIQWIRRNVKGSPVVAEANTPLYHWGSRVSIYTGLPGIIGWDWHERQQRSLVPGDVIDKRLQDVKSLFSSPNTDEAVKLIDRYNVDLIYLGEQERAFYPSEGLAKFELMARAGLLKTIFDNGAVRIYQVNRGS